MTLEEARRIYRIGAARILAGRARGGQHRFGWAPTWQQARHINGMAAVAEVTVAEWTGRRWLSDGMVPDDPLAGDVEGGLSIRWTPLERGSLIVHEDESLELIPVLVIGTTPPLTIVGWCPMAEAQDRRYWRTQGVRFPAFFVPYPIVARRPLERGIVDNKASRR